MYTKRFLTIMLAMMLLLASCGEAKPSKPTNVFRETLIEMPEEFKILDIDKEGRKISLSFIEKK